MILVLGTTASCARQTSEIISIVGYKEKLDVANGVLLAVTLKEPAGITRSFRVANDAPVNVDLGHLEIHRTMKIPVTLRVERRAGSLRVIAIDD
jgi:hypothetical protein